MRKSVPLLSLINTIPKIDVFCFCKSQIVKDRVLIAYFHLTGSYEIDEILCFINFIFALTMSAHIPNNNKQMYIFKCKVDMIKHGVRG